MNTVLSAIQKGWEKAKALGIAKHSTLYKPDNQGLPCYSIVWSEQLERTSKNPLGNPPLMDGTRVQRDTYTAVVDVLPEKDWLLRATYNEKDHVFEQLKDPADAGGLWLLELGVKTVYGS
jgi:hypothetical protein